MTQPKAAAQTRDGRIYRIPDRENPKTINEFPAWSALSGVLASPALTTWKTKTVAYHVATNQALRELAASGDTYGASKQALDLERSAANTGTAIHTVLDQHDMGADVSSLDGRLAEAVAVWRKLLADHHIEIIESERTVWNAEHHYAGTFDRIVRCPGLGTVMLDIKTGKGVYPDVALQLAAYANAEGIYDVDDGHRPMPPDISRAKALVAHLPAGDLDKARLVVVDISDATFMVPRVCWLWRWSRHIAPNVLLTDHAFADADELLAQRTEWLRTRITWLIDNDTDGANLLASRWPDDCPTLRQGGLTHDHIDQIVVALDSVERDRAAPFPADDPVAATA